MQLKANQTQISIPNSALTTYKHKEENRFRFGVLAPIAVSLLKACSKRHLISIGWKDESGAAQTATFETTRDRARGLVKVLETCALTRARVDPHGGEISSKPKHRKKPLKPAILSPASNWPDF